MYLIALVRLVSVIEACNFDIALDSASFKVSITLPTTTLIDKIFLIKINYDCFLLVIAD